MKPKIFIDGEQGTTGLQIRSRLEQRDDIELISLPYHERRDQAKRKALLCEADIAILCLPDDAAREAVAMAIDAPTRFIDASTAHRTHKDWAFGFAELKNGQSERIANARYVSNPGCYSTGAIALIAPLVSAGLVPSDYPLTINAVSGYSGGGKGMIAQMEDPMRDDAIKSDYFAYALTLGHKHVPEIITHAGLKRVPIFTPNVARFAQGMLVNIPLHLDMLGGDQNPKNIHQCLADHYHGQNIVEAAPFDVMNAMARICPQELVGLDTMRLYVCRSADNGQVNLVASLDNLGKGASGAAVQNLNLMIGSASS